jgi:hypothetical protein
MALIPKTLQDAGFDGVFTEVSHSEKLGLPNPSHLHLFHLAVENNRFSFDALNEFILDNIGNYVHSRATIDKMVTDGRERAIGQKALSLLQKAAGLNADWLSNELGNIFLYAFLEKILGAPKLYNKIELLADSNDLAFDGGGVHLLSVGDDTAPAYQMVFGKSNVIGDITEAIDNAFVSLCAVKANMKEEMRLINSTILPKSFPPEMSAKLLAHLKPSKTPSPPIAKAFGVFLGYSLGVPDGLTDDEFRDAVKSKMALDIKNHTAYIIKKINDAGMQNHSFYFYFLPLNNADDEKQSVMTELLKGGV